MYFSDGSPRLKYPVSKSKGISKSYVKYSTVHRSLFFEGSSKVQNNEAEIRASRLTTTSETKPKSKILFDTARKFKLHFVFLDVFFMDKNEKYATSHIVLMVVLVISATIGTIATVIWIRSLIAERSLNQTGNTKNFQRP